MSGRRWSRRFGEFKGKGSTLSCNETGEYFESKDDVRVTTNDEEVQKIVSFQRRNFRQAGASASSSRTAVTRWGWGRVRPPSNWRDMDPPSQAGLGPAPSPEAGGGFAGAGRQQEHQARPAVLSVRGAFQGYGGTCCQVDLLQAVWTSAMGVRLYLV